MNEQLRNPGYYWVRFQGGWIIAEWVNQPAQYWQITGSDRMLYDDDFSDISEKTIKP